MSDVLTEDEIIADVDVAQPQGTDNCVQSTPEGKLIVLLPAKWDKDALLNVAHAVKQQYSDQRGVQTLLSRVDRYVYHLDLCESTWEEMEASVRFLSGTRSDSGMPRASSNTPEKVAYAFYNTLNTPALRMQCTLFGLSYDSYDSVDGVIDALVAKQVEMMSVEG